MWTRDRDRGHVGVDVPPSLCGFLLGLLRLVAGDVVTDLCDRCGGEGWVDGLVRGDDIVPEVCRRCRGTGVIDVPEPTVEVGDDE